MDAWLEESMDPTERDLVKSHIGLCPLCARQLRSYEGAAPLMSGPIHKARPHKSADEQHPSRQPIAHPPDQRIRGFWQSPQLVLVLLAGILIVLAVVYLAMRTIPEGSSDAAVAKSAPDAPLDRSELDELPDAVASSAQAVVLAEEPELPEILSDVPPASGFALIYPVTETVESTQPAFSWQAVGPPPYSVVITGDRREQVTRAQGLPNPIWVVPAPLERGRRYTWQMTAGDGTSEQASFKILGQNEAVLWQGIRSRYANSDLTLGAVAQSLGMLTIAEREFEELVKANPNSEHAGRLLDNVLALREPAQQ
jgi:hypothetical protein